MHPEISVIMAVYNNESFVEEAVESVQCQTFTNWEMIVVDDCSQDRSPELIRKRAATDPRIKLLTMPRNSGAGGARDMAIQESNGMYVAIADADDVCEPERFEKQVAFLKAHPGIVAVGAQTVMIDEDGKQIGKKTFPIEPKKLHNMMYTAIPIQLPTLMVNRSLLPDDFDWFEEWRYSEDSLLFFKLAYHGKIANLPDFLLKYRWHPLSTSYRYARTYFYKTWDSRKIARKRYGYKPTVRARLVSLFQFAVITCLPGRFVPRVYKTLRHIMLRISGHMEEK